MLGLQWISMDHHRLFSSFLGVNHITKVSPVVLVFHLYTDIPTKNKSIKATREEITHRVVF